MQQDHYRWRLLGVVLVTMLSFGSSTTILGVALGELADDLGSTEAILSWTVTAPFLALGVATPVLGKLGDIHGHRRLHLMGSSVFAVGAVGTALSWDAASIIAFRSLAGLGAAAAFPAGLAMILANFRTSERPRALGWFNVVATGAPAVGLALSGAFIDWFGWRAVLGFYAGVGVLGAVLSAVAIRPTSPADVNPSTWPEACCWRLRSWLRWSPCPRLRAWVSGIRSSSRCSPWRSGSPWRS